MLNQVQHYVYVCSRASYVTKYEYGFLLDRAENGIHKKTDVLTTHRQDLVPFVPGYKPSGLSSHHTTIFAVPIASRGRQKRKSCTILTELADDD